MAGPLVKISELPVAGPILGSEILPVVQGGITSQATVSNLTGGLVGPPGPPGPPGPAGPPGPPGTPVTVGQPTSGFPGVWCPIVSSPLGGPPNTVQQWPGMTMDGGGSGAWQWQQASINLVFGMPGGSVVTFDNGAGTTVAFLDPGTPAALEFNWAGKLRHLGFPGGAYEYQPGTPSNWAPPAPTDLEAAMDRLASAVAGILGVPVP